MLNALSFVFNTAANSYIYPIRIYTNEVEPPNYFSANINYLLQ